MTDRPRIADYMTRDLVTLSPDDEITQAMHTLLSARISGAPVLDAAGELVGVLSKKDCLRAALHASYHRDWGGAVAHYMTREVETMEARTDIVTAAQRFVDSAFRRFPVVSDGRLVGQISRADVLRALAEQWSGTRR
ncbi:CBS domain-containing protein [Tranquillimonas alkanivorans]|uniref:CBS domain-containing protein n=1 Tax=Tranquillimonas alkanivorans TaxID=441119 RepID=A0A1I5U364_9RHOB|nr:CBS domain-containing protein [Tranquillimonas alkanivorans]SFP89709.1 CBS domain-containing protein [Tranquillimonas alkanivorans]